MTAATRKNPKAFLIMQTPLLLVVLLLLLLCNGAFGAIHNNNNNNNNVEDPYKVLGINRRANIETIKKAYRTKAKENHPDKNLHLDTNIANENFRRILDAFEILSDPIKKKKYDNQSSRQQRSSSSSSNSNSWWNNYNNNNNKNNNNNGYKTTFTYKGSRNSNNNNNNRNQQQRQQGEKERQRRKTAEKEDERQYQQFKQKAKLLQDKVWRFSTMKELHNMMFVKDQQKRSIINNNNNEYVYKKNLLLVFVGNKKVEKIVDDELLFPYPFAGIGSPNNILWDDVITSAKVRYNKETQLTKFYKVPNTNNKNNHNNNLNLQPHIIFAKKGDPVGKFYVFNQMYSNNKNKSWSSKRQEFIKWMTNQMLQIKVHVVNQHHSPIHIFRYDNSQVYHKLISWLEPGHSVLVNMYISDKLRVIDGRTDGFPGGEGFNYDAIFQYVLPKYVHRMLILDELIDVHENKSTIVVKSKYCYDMSRNCHTLVLRDPTICDDQSEYMHSICKVSCNVCSEIHPIWNTIQYGIFHYPIHKLPEYIHPPVEVIRAIGKVTNTLLLDITNIIKERRNVVFCFLAGGLLVGWNIAYLIESGVFDSIEYHLQKHNFKLVDIIMLPLSVTVLSLTYLFVSLIPRSDLKDLLISFRYLVQDAIVSLLCIGIAVWNLICTLYRWTFYTTTTEGGGVISRTTTGRGLLRFFLSFVVLSLFVVGVVVTANCAMEINPRRKYLWIEILSIRKNACTVIVIGGMWIGAALNSILRMAWHLKGYLFKSTTFNAMILVPMGYIVWTDQYFQKDLDHVLKFRMNAVGLFTIAGMIVGPLILTIPSYLFNGNNNNNNTTSSTSSSTTTTTTAATSDQLSNDDQKDSQPSSVAQ